MVRGPILDGSLITRTLALGDLYDDLDPALVGQTGGQALADGRRQRILSHVLDRVRQDLSRREWRRSNRRMNARVVPRGEARRLGDRLLVGLPVLKPISDMSN